MHELSGTVLMNLAAMDKGDLVILRGALLLERIDPDSDKPELAAMIAAITDELERRRGV